MSRPVPKLPLMALVKLREEPSIAPTRQLVMLPDRVTAPAQVLSPPWAAMPLSEPELASELATLMPPRSCRPAPAPLTVTVPVPSAEPWLIASVPLATVVAPV